MQSIVLKFVDGTERRFDHKGRSGGSYTIGVKYEGAFVIVTDEWGASSAFPSERVAEVQAKPLRSGGW